MVDDFNQAYVLVREENMKKSQNDLSSLIVPESDHYAPTRAHEYFRLSIRELSAGNHGMFDRNVGAVGLFADEKIPAGSLVMMDGGVIIRNIEKLPDSYRGFGSVIGENLWLVPYDFERKQKSLSLNHSCSPNLDRTGLFGYRANKTIHPHEELTIDFAPFVASLEWWKFECHCDSPRCRKIITGNDYLNPHLARELWDQWSPFIQRRISNQALF